MLEIVSLFCFPIAAALLIALIVIDLRVQLLPNNLVLGLAVTGFAFHACALFYYIDVKDIVIGAFIGGGSLYLIRAVGNKFYKTETLGLGDVKLMAAGGLWLGPVYILQALIAGAIAGLIHGSLLIGHNWLKTKKVSPLSRFSLPAGPGFAAGLFVAALAKFWGLPHLSL
ncbi:MAG: A24 family peptidase [Pseudomonadota bacterium]